MALTSLATTTDLGVTGSDAERALTVASAVIREAAGSAISAVTGTVVVPAPSSGTVLALPGPITAVTAVLVDGVAVTDYENVSYGLWRRGGWADSPVPVSVTGTFGLAEVPADIVDLCCVLAKSWLEHKASGGASVAGLKSIRLDDAAEGYTDEAAGQVTPVFLPVATREWLATRFGGGVHIVETL